MNEEKPETTLDGETQKPCPEEKPKITPDEGIQKDPSEKPPLSDNENIESDEGRSGNGDSEGNDGNKKQKDIHDSMIWS